MGIEQVDVSSDPVINTRSVIGADGEVDIKAILNSERLGELALAGVHRSELDLVKQRGLQIEREARQLLHTSDRLKQLVENEEEFRNMACAYVDMWDDERKVFVRRPAENDRPESTQTLDELVATFNSITGRRMIDFLLEAFQSQ